MIIRNCHKKYNLCRNDAAASPFGTFRKLRVRKFTFETEAKKCHRR